MRLREDIQKLIREKDPTCTLQKQQMLTQRDQSQSRCITQQNFMLDISSNFLGMNFGSGLTTRNRNTEIQDATMFHLHPFSVHRGHCPRPAVSEVAKPASPAALVKLARLHPLPASRFHPPPHSASCIRHN